MSRYLKTVSMSNTTVDRRFVTSNLIKFDFIDAPRTTVQNPHFNNVNNICRYISNVVFNIEFEARHDE